MKITMKKIINQYIFLSLAAVSLSFGATSCTSYLDKTADSDVNPDMAFMNFQNFQGFVEEAYNCIPNKESNYWCCTFNWGEDEIMNTGLGDTHVTAHFDLGDYRHWQNDAQSYLHSNALDPTSKDKYAHSLEHAWYVIRKMNLGLANMDKLTNATQEEKNFIKGQLLFMRAWWHFEQMIYFGGLPYVDFVIPADGPFDLPRLSFQECAKKAAEDFAEAAKLLPDNWDNTAPGKRTPGKNDIRLTKVCALGYMGKALLWAASPLNELGAQVGASKNGNTYKYNTTLAQQAADALAQAINALPASPYDLAEYKYSDIYNHVADKSSSTNFSDIFRTTGQGWRQPGSVEAIMRGCQIEINGSNWNFTKLWGPKVNNLVEHDALIHMPTANYINYAYGMADGTPAYIIENGKLVANDASRGGSFDPKHPFQNRDPRFYHDIMFDGFKFINNTPGAADAGFQYLEMFTGGNMVPTGDAARSANGSRTGYFCQKLVPHQCNKYDGMYNWGDALQTYLPYMRVADLYLMYAEACAAAGGATQKGANCNLNAVDAINVLRDRVGAGHVSENLVGDRNKFMDEVRRERACELAFEGFRWNDLQRWLLLTESPYNIKTRQEFKRVGNYDFSKNDPRDAEVTGWGETVIVERSFGTKHYLLPLKDDETYLYAEYPQNPGW
jgi:hypothetical protein